MDIIRIICFTHFILLGIYLIIEKNKRNEGVKLLGLFFFLLGFHFFVLSLKDNAVFSQTIFARIWLEQRYVLFLLVSLAPSLFLFNQFYMEDERKFSSRDLVHLIGYAMPIFHLIFPEIVAQKEVDRDLTYQGIFIHLQNFIYIVLSINLLKKEETYRNKRLLLKHINYTYLTIVLTWSIVEVVRIYTTIPDSTIIIFYWVLLFYMVDGTIIICWKYPDLIMKSKYIRNRLGEWKTEKYQESRIDNKYAEKVLDALRKHLEKPENYTNSDLKLATASDITGFPQKDISQVINMHIGKSFNEYLNDLRISEASRLLSNEKNLNVNEVMYQVGFNSKSLFFKYFKERHGMTPFEFKNKSHAMLDEKF